MPTFRLRKNNSTNRDRIRAQLAGAQQDGYRQAWLICGKKHQWKSDIDAGSEDRAGVQDPRCPQCGEFYSAVRTLQVVYDETIQCTASCWNAKKPWEVENPKCVCSCNGRNHATGEPMTGLDDAS